jgi:hypothetical protein
MPVRARSEKPEPAVEDDGVLVSVVENSVTIRQFGAAGIKLLGVYFAISGLIGMAGVAAFFVGPPIEGMPSAREVVLLNGLSFAGVLMTAALCMFGGDALAGRIFGEGTLEVTQVSRRDLLWVGLSLIGATTVLEGIPALVQFAGQALWYAEASRQQLFGPLMERSWQSVANGVIALVVGGALAAGAGRITSALEGRYVAGSDDSA